MGKISRQELNDELNNELNKIKNIEDNYSTKTELQNVNDSLTSHLAETVSKVVLVTEPYNQVTTTTVNLGFKPKSVSIQFEQWLNIQ